MAFSESKMIKLFDEAIFNKRRIIKREFSLALPFQHQMSNRKVQAVQYISIQPTREQTPSDRHPSTQK